MVGGWVGEAIAKKRLKKKGGEVIEERREPEQILASNKNNFSVNYEDIVGATIEKKKCTMKFTKRMRRGGMALTNFWKKITFEFDEKDKTNVVSILTEVIPNKVVVK